MLDYLSNAGISSKPRFSDEILTYNINADIIVNFSSELGEISGITVHKISSNFTTNFSTELGEISHEKVFREVFNLVSNVVLELNLNSRIIIEEEIVSAI